MTGYKRVWQAVVAAVLVPLTMDVPAATYGGQGGFDPTIEAVEPDNAPVRMGLAGTSPPTMGRFLMAGNGALRGAQLAPGGAHVAYLWSVTGAPQVWVQSLAGGEPRQLTFGSGVSFFAWLNAGQLIYGADNDGNEQEGFYTMSLDGRSERELLPARPGDFRVYGGASASGDLIAFASTARNGSDFDIYTASGSTGETRKRMNGEFFYAVDSVSPSGRYLVLSEAVGEDAHNLYLFDTASDALTVLSRPERRGYQERSVWRPDDSGFYILRSVGREFQAIDYYDVAQSTFTVVQQAEVDIDQIALCGKRATVLVWTENRDGFSVLRARDTVTGDRVILPTPENSVVTPQCPPDSNLLLLGVSSYREPGGFQVINLDSGAQTLLREANLAGLNPDALVKPKSIRLPARDGVVLQGLLYTPAVPTAKPPPVVFFVHGGPTAQARPTYSAVVQYHLSRGMAVFQPNVRGSTGFGFTYLSLDDRRNRLDSIRDLVDMLKGLGDLSLVDTANAAVVGGSYGGYAVNAVLAEYPGVFKVGASLFGVADWVTALEVASPALRASDRIEYGDITDPEWRAFYASNSPINNADRINVPVLYSHGVMDPRIDIAETEKMVKTLRANNIEAPFVRIPDEGHGWSKLKNQLFYYRYQADFLMRHLTPAD